MAESQPSPGHEPAAAAPMVRLLGLLRELEGAATSEETASRAAAAALQAAGASAAAVLLGEGPERQAFIASAVEPAGRELGRLPAERARALFSESVALPLEAGGARFGELLVQGPVADADPALLQAIAASCALALDRAEALERRRDQQERVELLAEVGALDGTDRGPVEALARLVELAVPGLADFCTLDLVEDGGLARLAATHRDPTKGWILSELGEASAGRELAGPAARALASGRAAIYPELPAPALAAMARGGRHAELLSELAPTSAVSVPILARGELRGVLSLGMSSSGRRHAASDLPLVEELARRAGSLLEHALLRESFLTVASHELKTPLTSLQLALQSTERAVQKLADDGAREQALARLATAERQVKRLTALIDQLLDLSRLQLGHVPLEPRELDLVALLRELLDNARGELARAGCELTLVAPAELRATLDPARFEQLVTNLLSNAQKFGARRPVHVELAAADGFARLSVKDHGIGIAPVDHERIFERFERAVPSSHYSGFGVGLFVVRRVAEAMGGHVRLESAPDQGATFVVELPLKPAS